MVVLGNLFEYRIERADSQRIVCGDGYMVFPGLLSCEANVRPNLTRRFVPKTPEGGSQLGA